MGTPQRRRRIALVADFRGQSAPEILFERKGVSGNIEQGSQTRQEIAGGTTDSIGETGVRILNPDDSQGNHVAGAEVGICPTLRGCEGSGYQQGAGAGSIGYQEEVSPTLRGVEHDAAVSVGNGQLNNITMSDKANCLDLMHDQQLVLKANSARRLTPLECERVQGFPDGWTNIPGATDSKRYKALGNSIALPAWEFWARRFVEIGGVKTIGSLFDGIGGFPLCFKRAGAETLWTSEIEPFCEEVVEYHLKLGDL